MKRKEKKKGPPLSLYHSRHTALSHLWSSWTRNVKWRRRPLLCYKQLAHSNTYLRSALHSITMLKSGNTTSGLDTNGNITSGLDTNGTITRVHAVTTASQWDQPADNSKGSEPHLISLLPRQPFLITLLIQLNRQLGQKKKTRHTNARSCHTNARSCHTGTWSCHTGASPGHATLAHGHVTPVQGHVMLT